jgi:hypothetical protein
MNATERDQLLQFLSEISRQRLAHKDPVAEQLIRDALAHHPDALYLLVQRALLAELALKKHASETPVKTAAAPEVRLPLPGVSFLNPSLIASTALGVAIGSWLGGELSEWDE